MIDGYMENNFQMILSSLLPATLTEGILILIFLSSLLVGFSIYRHSDEMIERLEKAGLGFYVRASETHQRLGI